MAKRTIPERSPIGDPFTGVVLGLGARQVLAQEALPGANVIASGEFVIRYGVRFLGKLHLSIVPGLVVLDYGDFLTGEEAWTFLIKRSNLYPRSEVVGYRSDGVDDMQFIRALDLAAPIDVLVYADSAAVLPLARPTAIIAPDAGSIAPRILEYLPRYASFAGWQQEINT